MENTYIHASKTKIVATLGPSSSDEKTITRMLTEGMSVARFNMSHGSHESHAALMHTARTAAKNAGLPLAILQDLSGPKIRIGDFSTESIVLKDGQKFTLTTKKCIGDTTHVWVNYKKLPREVEKGTIIFLNDGKLTLKVIEVAGTEVVTRVMNGGEIRGRRGVNVPDGNLSVSPLTTKDKKDLIFGLSQGVDFVTLSFVRTGDDIRRLRRLIDKKYQVTIIAKIETKAAIQNIHDIIDAADAIMVARGDLAIEVPPEEVPLLQKQIIRDANRAGKPVITATQMLDSMRTSVVPTRAEVNDVANAILDGTDAVMLSDESAVGNHPALAVRYMTRVARTTESSPVFAENRKQCDFEPETICDTVSRSIAHAVHTTGAKAVVAFSESGYTGRMVARYRPPVPILVLTPHEKTYNRSLITYACEPVLVHKVKGFAEARRVARKALEDRKLVKKGEPYVLGAGIPFGNPGATNMMLVERMGRE